MYDVVILTDYRYENPIKKNWYINQVLKEDQLLLEAIKKKGGILGSSVSKKTFVVLVLDKDESTGKADQARSLSIPLMTPEEFKTKYIN